ncbi:CvpA family protein [Xinfangfangia sp. CPCC 101601]|uniref:CvpA family protein n=1 Tax=Pseudogemmobacter lacusdianii TaxID=3069608 RepID=A0ABU0W0L7_9RHOB|nr:CvpA family protein [Xinfangfangia sp. CPCC 101601]MDQ2066955.1 CvpA family protein [Xinfangfangia sp. CPCC 101601]
MENFTAVDGVAALVILLSAILAYSRGLVRELMAILGWIGAAVLAFIFAPAAKPLVAEIPVIGDFLADSCELSVIGAFAAVFAIGLILMALFTPLFASVVQRSALGGVDQGLGFLFGVARGVLLIAVAFIVWDRALSNQSVPMIDNSRTAKVFGNFQSAIDGSIPTDAPGWIVARYNELTMACAPEATAPTSAAPTEMPPAEAAPAN